MGYRDRGPLDGSTDYERRDLNLTKYEEKYILPTDGAAYINGEKLQEPEKPAESQSRISDPHLAETRLDGTNTSRSVDEKFVFGSGEQKEQLYPTDTAPRSVRSSEPSSRSGFSSSRQPAEPAPRSGFSDYSQTPSNPSARSGFSNYAQQSEPTGRYDRSYSQPSEPAVVRSIQGYIQPISPSSTAERPMVFSLRDIRDMYVYEYSDRLEFYRKTDRGTMVFCSTEFKSRVN